MNRDFQRINFTFWKINYYGFERKENEPTEKWLLEAEEL